MNETITDLEKLERDSFRRFYEDGLFDVYIGAMLLVFFGASTLWEQLESTVISYVGMLALALIVTVPLLAYRRRLLRTRLGTFQPGPRRRLRITRTRWVLAGSVVVGLAAFGIGAVAATTSAPIDVVTIVVPLLWLVNAVVVFGAMAYFLEVPRFYVYGVVLGLLMPLLIWPDALWDMEVPAFGVFGVAGLAVIATGLYKLRRFLQQYPEPGSSQARHG